MERLSRVVGPDRDERPRPRRRAHARGDRHRHGDAVAGLDRRRARRPRLDAQAHRLDARPLGPHRRQRGRGRHTGAEIAVHPARPRAADRPAAAVGAVRHRPVRAGGRARRGRRRPVRRDPPARPAHARPHGGLGLPPRRGRGLLYSGDTLFAGGWGRVDLPGGDPDAMVASLARLTGLEDQVGVFPGHGPATTIGRERAWMELVRDGGRLFA